LFDVEILSIEGIGRIAERRGDEMLELYDTTLRSTVAAERHERLASAMAGARRATPIRRRLGALLVRVGERLESEEPECIATPAPVRG
jgi:hypothetical protein